MSTPDCCPRGVAILAHVHCTCDRISLGHADEVPRDRIAGNLHRAAKLDVIRVHDSLESRLIDLACLRTREYMAILLQRKSLLTCSAGKFDFHRPRAGHLRGCALRNYGVLMVSGMTEDLE